MLRDYVEQHEFGILGILLALVLGTAGIWAVWKVPKLQVQHAVAVAKASKQPPGTVSTESLPKGPSFAEDYAKQLELEDNFRKTIVQTLGGAFLLLGLYYTAKTFGLSREGQITDRFTKAIEQLGWVNGDKPSIEVRLGAIYALERIAIDSPRDHWTIMEVLTAYIRQNAPIRANTPYTEGETPRTDIQAILTVLGRRRTGPKRERAQQHLDLSSSTLCGAYLFRANLQDAYLSWTNLQRARLSFANLQGASLTSVNLQHADLSGINLRDANLWVTDLQDADLSLADLQGADLAAASLQGADLREANLQGANLHGARLQGAKSLSIDQIKAANNWSEAHYSQDVAQSLGVPSKDNI